MTTAEPRPKPAVRWSDRRHVGRVVADVHGRRRDLVLDQPQPALLKLAQALTPAVYVDLGRPCNSACLYCAVPPHEDAQGFLPLAEVPSIASAGRQVGCDRAILIGGEPTIYPHLSEALTALRDCGLSGPHIVMTNGLRLAEPRFVASLYQGGIRTFHVSVDTVDSTTYDRLSRSSGRLEKQLRGLDCALQAHDCYTYLYAATTRANATTLPDLLRYVADRADRLGLREPPPVLFAVVKPLGDALRHADALLIEPEVAAVLVSQLVELGEQLGVPTGYRNLQACLVPHLVSRNVDYYLDDFSVEVATGQRVTYSHATDYWWKPKSCEPCGHYALCTGLYRQQDVVPDPALYAPIGRNGLKAQ